jgi:hypothetical protein
MLLLLIAAVSAGDFAPCTEGLAIEYQLGTTRITDTMKGTDARRLCRIERVTVRAGQKPETDAYLREMLPDRVLSAGYASTPLAQRPPMLVGPIEVGQHWQFNRVRYRIASLEPCAIEAVKTARCLTVEAAGDDGSKNRAVYAEGIGLVLQTFGETTMTAIDVRVPKSDTAPKSRVGARR